MLEAMFLVSVKFSERSHLVSGELVILSDGSDHHQRDGENRVHAFLSCGGLYEVSS